MIHKRKRIIALVLAFLMLLSVAPSASAAYANGYTGSMAGDGNGIYAHGVDLSEWQGNHVDFAKIKAQGYSYVILRVGFATKPDETFETNYIKAKNAGLDVGVYLYSYADNVQEALKEADACKNWLTGRQLEYPVYYDLEDPKTHGSMSKEELSKIATAFMDEMSASGWLVGLYSCLSWLNNKIDTPNVCAQYECWMAQYLNSGTYELYDRYDEVYGMWQYSATGRVDGIDGNVDLNVSFKDYPGICRQYGFNGYTASDDTVILSGVSVPDAMKTGNGFSIKGTVTSTKGILTDVTVGIYNQSGQPVMHRSSNNGKNSYDLSLFASAIRPNELSAGKYYYRISASNSYESRMLLNHSFWVSDTGVVMENVSVPQDLRTGDSFKPEGVLYSVEKMPEVRVTVEDGKGNSLCKAVAYPNKTIYKISELQESLTLSTLTPGEYSYHIYISLGGKLQEVLSEKFTVWMKNDPITFSNYSLRSEYSPGQLTGISGKLSSKNSKIQALKIQIKNTAGETVALVDTTCDQKEISLADYSGQLDLKSLPVGKYSCRITATNAAGPTIMASTAFLIREDVISLCEFSAPSVLGEGDSFLISGAVAGNVSPLKYVCISVYDEDGNRVLSAADIPTGNVYDLSKLQDRLLFSNLPKGNYILNITAENTRGFEELLEAPFYVTDSDDRIRWMTGSFVPNKMTFSQSAPFAMWGTLVSNISEISSVKVEIWGEDEEPITAAFLSPESKEVSLDNCNENLRLSALAPGEYRLQVTAENAAGSFVMLNSIFYISECLHGNVASGNAHFATCSSAGAICASQCLDCGAKVRNGTLLPIAEHEYRSGICGGCGRTEFRLVPVEKLEGSLKNNDRIVIVARQGENWYALSMNGSAVPISAPGSESGHYVGADVLWTVNLRREKCNLTNPSGRTLHLDQEGIAICRGNKNAQLEFFYANGTWKIGLQGSQPGRFLSYNGKEFFLSDIGSELFLFRYCPADEKS